MFTKFYLTNLLQLYSGKTSVSPMYNDQNNEATVFSFIHYISSQLNNDLNKKKIFQASQLRSMRSHHHDCAAKGS